MVHIQHYAPPNSPDLNPVDYCVWGRIQEMVSREDITHLKHLKNEICVVYSVPGYHEQFYRFMERTNEDGRKNRRWSH